MVEKQNRRLRVVIYLRLSHKKNEEQVSLATQEKLCRALAKRNGWDVVMVYTDDDRSAFKARMRPEFEAMVKAISVGEFDVLAVYHIDRLYRSLKDLARLIEIAQERGLQIATVKAGDIDLSTATGRMLATILCGVAVAESERNGERRTDANTERAERGQWRKEGPRLFGWTQDGEQIETEANAIRQAVQDVLDGVSLRSIAGAWNDSGLRTPKLKKRGGNEWTNLTLRRVLLNPTHAGHRTYSERKVVDGKDVYEARIVGPGTWEPIVDPEDHKGLVALLTARSKRNATAFERAHPGSGVYLCGVCGGPLHAGFTGGRMQYRCRSRGTGKKGERRAPHVARRGAPVDEMVERVVLGVLSQTDIAKRLTDSPGVDTDALQAKRRGLLARKDELATMFTEGVLDGPAVRREAEKLKERVKAVDETLAEAARRSIAATLLVDGPDELERHWDQASPDIKGKVIDELMTVTVLRAVRGRKEFDPDTVRIEPKK